MHWFEVDTTRYVYGTHEIVNFHDKIVDIEFIYNNLDTTKYLIVCGMLMYNKTYDYKTFYNNWE